MKETIDARRRTEFLKAILVDSGLWQRDFEAMERG